MSWMVIHFNIPLKKKISHNLLQGRLEDVSAVICSAKIYCNKRMDLEQLETNETKHICPSLFSHVDSFHQLSCLTESLESLSQA